MTLRTKKVDMSSLPFGRSVTWSSGTGDFVNTDILDIQGSLMKGSSYLTVQVSAASSCAFRVNARTIRYPLYENALIHGINAPDLQNGVEVIDENALAYTLTAGEVLELTDLPVANLQFTALAGTVVVTAR